MTQQIEGIWRNEYIQDGVTNFIEYEFEGNEFNLMSSNSKEILDGSFSIDGDRITFQLFSENINWTQKFTQTEACLCLHADDEGHLNGRFLKEND